jgi:hypothetical protein
LRRRHPRPVVAHTFAADKRILVWLLGVSCVLCEERRGGISVAFDPGFAVGVKPLLRVSCSCRRR